jgi:phosphohistidine swiveling domain-containing protein
MEKKLIDIRKQVPEIIKRRTELLKQYNLEKISPWLEFLDQYARYHEVRKEMQMKTSYALHLIMLGAAKRLGLSKADLNWLWGNEAKKLLQGGKLNKEEISRRKEAILTLINDKGLRIFSGAAAIKKYKAEIEEIIENVSEAKGFCAMAGKARGRAKVCNGLEDALKKIKKSDILICGMTTPDYISVMKKAAAIVTDEGGLTCHAAIISRELKIPCIVGTKIATKIFKDGDLVEVDAANGIIKILK